jgi:SulP family sulfate permease
MHGSPPGEPPDNQNPPRTEQVAAVPSPNRRKRVKRWARSVVPGVTTPDAIAGVSMAFVLIPQSLAFAALAGLPAYVGLYAAALPPLAAAFFASSPYLQTGPTAVTSILVAGALTTLALAGSQEYIALAGLLAIVVGLIRVGIGLARAGKIVYLMSEPVLRGFTSGAALLILMSQVPIVLGLAPAPAGGPPSTVAWVLFQVEAWSLETALLALGTLAIVGGASRIHPVVPGVLIATAAGIAYSVIFEYGGPVMGDLPSLLPGLNLSLPWTRLPSLLLPGVVIALVGFSEAASIARTYAARERQRWDPDRDFISQGVANLAAGMSGGFPVGGSFSRSGLAHMIGARTRWSGAVTGLTVIAFMPFAGLLAPLPAAVLGGMVMVAVVRLVALRPILELWRLSRPQFLVASSTFLLTLMLAPRIDEAVVLGIGLAVAVHLWREFKVKFTSWTEEGSLHVRPEGVLWFGSAQMLETEVLKLLADNAETGRLVLHMERLGRVDLTASIVLAQLIKAAREGGLDTEIVAVHPVTAKALRRVLRHDRANPSHRGAAPEGVDHDGP